MKAGDVVRLASGRDSALWKVERINGARVMLRLVGGTETKWSFVRLYSPA